MSPSSINNLTISVAHSCTAHLPQRRKYNHVYFLSHRCKKILAIIIHSNSPSWNLRYRLDDGLVIACRIRVEEPSFIMSYITAWTNPTIIFIMAQLASHRKAARIVKLGFSSEDKVLSPVISPRMEFGIFSW